VITFEVVEIPPERTPSERLQWPLVALSELLAAVEQGKAIRLPFGRGASTRYGPDGRAPSFPALYHGLRQAYEQSILVKQYQLRTQVDPRGAR
jgi:hypothetical protein